MTVLLECKAEQPARTRTANGAKNRIGLFCTCGSCVAHCQSLLANDIDVRSLSFAPLAARVQAGCFAFPFYTAN